MYIYIFLYIKHQILNVGWQRMFVFWGKSVFDLSVACFRHIGLFLNFAFCIVHGEVYRLRDHFGFWVTQISRCSIYQSSVAF